VTLLDSSVTAAELPGQQMHWGDPFPLVLRCDAAGIPIDDAAAWITSSRETLAAQLAAHGAVLFRGFPVANDRDFDAFVTAFGERNFPYAESLSNAVRVNRTERVFTANEAPPEVTIYLHHEMAQTPVYPGKLFFYCEQPADEGGETPLCRSDVLFEQLTAELPSFAKACEEKGLRYTNVMPPEADLASGMGRSWQSTLRADSREAAENRLANLGYTWEWLDDGSLRATTPVLPAVKQLPSGRKSFFNQLIAAFRGWKDARNDPSKSITLGDGSPLDTGAALRAAEMAEALSFNVPWQAGDVALVDNTMVMHGRRTFRGTRRVLASLIAAEN